jgi:hypothetical protein
VLPETQVRINTGKRQLTIGSLFYHHTLKSTVALCYIWVGNPGAISKIIFVNLVLKGKEMAIIIAFNSTVKNIVSEVEAFDRTEQESILAYLRARRMQKQPVRNFVIKQKPLSMASIDAIKHKTCKGAGK